MTLRLHIERLVIDASLGLDPRALEAALAEGLAQALLHQPNLPLLQQGGSVAALGGATIQLGGSPDGWGRHLGGALHAALAGSMPREAGKPGAVTP